MSKYLIAEKFKSVQGEGVYAGTPMAFIRFVGCSVGKTVCPACDTDWEQPIPWRGGGEFDVDELVAWTAPYEHVCFTGGEPLDQGLGDLLEALHRGADKFIHVETSGTKPLGELDSWPKMWICVSPKPGFVEDVVMQADEIKVIMPGLGVLKNGVCVDVMRGGYGVVPQRWPTLQDALRWAAAGKTVFVQPRNARSEVDRMNLKLCQDICAEHPELRLSVQLHKILGVQ